MSKASPRLTLQRFLGGEELMIRAVWPIASIKLKGPPQNGTWDDRQRTSGLPNATNFATNFVMAYQLAPAKYKRWKTHMQDVLTAEQVVDIVIVTDCHGEPCAAQTFPTSSTCGQCQQGTIHHLDPQNSRSSPGSRTWQQTVIFNKSDFPENMLFPIWRVDSEWLIIIFRINIRIWG